MIKKKMDENWVYRIQYSLVLPILQKSKTEQFEAMISNLHNFTYFTKNMESDRVPPKGR